MRCQRPRALYIGCVFLVLLVEWRRGMRRRRAHRYKRWTIARACARVWIHWGFSVHSIQYHGSILGVLYGFPRAYDPVRHGNFLHRAHAKTKSCWGMPTAWNRHSQRHGWARPIRVNLEFKQNLTHTTHTQQHAIPVYACGLSFVFSLLNANVPQTGPSCHSEFSVS